MSLGPAGLSLLGLQAGMAVERVRVDLTPLAGMVLYAGFLLLVDGFQGLGWRPALWTEHGKCFLRAAGLHLFL